MLANKSCNADNVVILLIITITSNATELQVVLPKGPQLGDDNINNNNNNNNNSNNNNNNHHHHHRRRRHHHHHHST